jgi:hypothetical protein
MNSLSSSEKALAALFPASESHNRIMTLDDAVLSLHTFHLVDLCLYFRDSIKYVEDGLRKQLVKAIGKELRREDFDEFMNFYSAKIFESDYVPKAFSHAVRRPNHYPEGILSIEEEGPNALPITTLLRRIHGNSSYLINIPINAAATVAINGDIFLHGYMQHRTEDSYDSGNKVLAARSRQFSSFLIIVGKMAGPNLFKPSNAMILQNKDEILIPLLIQPLPSAKEFKDSISSLSSTQQAFAKEIRAMQLESSVFGVCIIQLKPQLEKLLGLPEYSLTKEIQLTQDLLSLFVEYQIPPDIVSFDGSNDVNVTEKIGAVKGHVNAVLDMIETTKRKQLEEEKKKSVMYVQMELHEANDSNEDLPNAIPSAVPNAMPSAVPGALPSAVPNAMPSAVPNAVPSATPNEVPMSLDSPIDFSEDNQKDNQHMVTPRNAGRVLCPMLGRAEALDCFLSLSLCLIVEEAQGKL